MAVGTAGYTAALCVMALQKHGTRPGDGAVLVTGATGGVGSVAVTLLAGLGYRVTASSGRPHEAGYLRALGATEIIDRAELSGPGKPLQPERWAGVVDAVGSHTLANACAATRWNGAVAACGLAQGADFPSSCAASRCTASTACSSTTPPAPGPGNCSRSISTPGHWRA